MPDGADCVNDMPREQVVALGQAGLSGWTPADFAASIQQLGSRGTMYGTIHPTTAQQ